MCKSSRPRPLRRRASKSCDTDEGVCSRMESGVTRRMVPFWSACCSVGEAPGNGARADDSGGTHRRLRQSMRTPQISSTRYIE